LASPTSYNSNSFYGSGVESAQNFAADTKILDSYELGPLAGERDRRSTALPRLLSCTNCPSLAITP